MNIDDIKTQASTLKNNLLSSGIEIRHTNAIDLIAAVYGYRNRQLLNTTALVRPDKPCTGRLSEVARNFARHDEKRHATIVAQTLRATYLASPATIAFSHTVRHGYNGRTVNVELTADMFEDPLIFVNSSAGTAIIGALAENAGYERYGHYGNDGPMTLRQGNELAAKILEAIETGDHPDWVIAEFFDHGLDAGLFVQQEMRSVAQDLIEALNETAADNDLRLSGSPSTDWEFAIEDALIDKLGEHDTSSAADMLGRGDEAEVVFFLKPSGTHVMDSIVCSNKPWSTPAELSVDHYLQHILASLGYTVTDFRKATGNKHPSQDLRRIPKRRPPVASMDQIVSIVETACSESFHIVLYAIVPIKDLLRLEKNKPITFSKARLASYNPYSGTFFDDAEIRDITLSPEEGVLQSCHGYYSPDDICGLVTSYYRATVTNPPDNDGASSADRLAA